MKKWTKNEIQKLIILKNNNFSLKYIGNELNRSSNAVSKALSRYHHKYIYIKNIKYKNTLLNKIKIFNLFSKKKIIIINKKFFYDKEYISYISLLIILNRFNKFIL